MLSSSPNSTKLIGINFLTGLVETVMLPLPWMKPLKLHYFVLSKYFNINLGNKGLSTE